MSDSHPFNWKPVRHSFFRDEKMADILHHDGITTQPFLEKEQLTALRELFAEHHDIPKGNGGMFYTVYSQDLAYRERMNREINQILKPTLDKWFTGYKNIINSFVVKVPGPASEFALHQDTTAVDEFKYSAMTVWIPLVDVDVNNGAMCVIPGTHHYFSPYRGVSYPFSFENIEDEIRPYLQPAPVKAGDAILFDPRILHNSLPNHSDKERIAIICGIFPEDAQFEICYKESPEHPIDIWRQEDDFALKNPNFMHHCHARPISGEVIKQLEDKFPMLKPGDFIALAEKMGLKPQNLLPPVSELNCNMIAEPGAEQLPPIHQVEPALTSSPPPKRSFFQRLFSWGS